MLKNVRDGKFDFQYYQDMWAKRLQDETEKRKRAKAGLPPATSASTIATSTITTSSTATIATTPITATVTTTITPAAFSAALAKRAATSSTATGCPYRRAI